MNAQDRYNSERYPDMTCFLALRNIERNERKERRNRMKENWIYRRGDVYLANLDPYIGSEQGGTVDYNIKCNTKKYGHHTHFRVKCNYHKTKDTEVEYEVLYTFYTI